MDDQAIITLIQTSQMTAQDKQYWTDILPKLGDQQRQELFDILTIKAKVRHAISEIDHALETIEAAENEVESSPSTIPDSPSVDLKSKYEQIQKSAPDKQDLQRIRAEELQRLDELRNQLKNLSLSADGTVAPSLRSEDS